MKHRTKPAPAGPRTTRGCIELGFAEFAEPGRSCPINEVSDYPESDWPYTFYFNGHKFPKWSAQWHLCALGDFLNDFADDWDEFIGYGHIWHLQCRLDHVGIVESEDPLILRVCAQEVLLKLVTHRDDVLDRIQASSLADSSRDDVFGGIIDGLARMISISNQDGYAFWISGYEADQERLRDYISRFSRSVTTPDAIEPPHISQRRSELHLRSRSQIKDLRILAQNGTLDKRLRTLVNQLPNGAEQGVNPNAGPASSSKPP